MDRNADEAPPLLRMTQISKSFSGVQALQDVHLEMQSGEVHALMGENGAGKSTLIKVLSGTHRPDAGNIEIDGQSVTIDTPSRAHELGIGLIPQELELSPNLTAAENIYMGREPCTRFGWVNNQVMESDARDILDRLGAEFAPSTPVGNLNTAQQQLVEIAKALALNTRLLIMDESTSSLSENEAERLFEIVHDLRDQDVAIVYITHRMKEVYEVADRVTILRDGQYIDTQDVSDVSEDSLIESMVGRSLGDLYASEAHEIGDIALEIRNLTDGGYIAPTDLTLHRGEIVGLAGLVGAGRTELARMIFGIDPVADGEIIVEGQPVSINSPADSINASMGYVPESRSEQGLFLELSVEENISLNSLSNFSTFGFIKQNSLSQLAQEYVDKLNIRLASLGQDVITLSGGNQQKVLLAKWLTRNPSILLLDEPTRGVDVGAKAEIYSLIAQLAQGGVAILMISSELPEIIGMSDRILVMNQGKLVAELPGGTTTQEEIMAHCTGSANNPQD